MVTSTSESNPEVVAESLFNFRNGELFGLRGRWHWSDDRDGVSVRALPDEYCSEKPCLSLFVEKTEGGYFSELEGASVRLYTLPPYQAEVHGEMRTIHRGTPIAEGILEKGKVEFAIPHEIDVFVEIIRQDTSLKNSDERELAIAG